VTRKLRKRHLLIVLLLALLLPLLLAAALASRPDRPVNDSLPTTTEAPR